MDRIVLPTRNQDIRLWELCAVHLQPNFECTKGRFVNAFLAMGNRSGAFTVTFRRLIAMQV